MSRKTRIASLSRTPIFLALFVCLLCSLVARPAWCEPETLAKDSVESPISEETAADLAKQTEERTGIPIVINDRVLYWLNHSLRSSRARSTLRSSLKRMEKFESMIRSKLEAKQLPVGLLVIPMLESGYRNMKSKTGAGIWSFVPRTARRYGLKVSKKHDERRDAAKETEAAATYLSELYKQFGTWHLALLAYNAGEGTVQKAMAHGDSRDVFELADNGSLLKKGNRDYVPRLLAMLVIMFNPELLKS